MMTRKADTLQTETAHPRRARGMTTQLVADALRELILSGQFRAGEPLRQSRLADQLGTSRVPLREAFHLLEAEGLVSLRSNRGAVVMGLSSHEILQYQEMRARLETWLLELAIPIMTEADFEKAEHYLALMKDCAEQDWSELNLEFHCALYAPADRDVIMQNVRKLYLNSYRRFRSPIFNTRDRDKSHREHRDILDLCHAGNVQAAVDRLESHILMNGRKVVDQLKAAEARS